VVGGLGISYHVVVGFRGREDGPCDRGQVQAREEDWERIVWRALPRYALWIFFLPPPCVLWCMHVGDRNGWIGFAGVNVQNGEEVAVKLVCGEQLS
jgi:hypothetical protein